MSKEVVFIVRDDIDGSRADETLTFAVRGRNYEIDLSSANVELFEKSLFQFIEAARVQETTNSASPTPVSSASKREMAKRRKEIRVWASRNGWPELGESTKGRTPYAALDAYRATHPEVELPPEMIPKRPDSVKHAQRLRDDDLESVTAQDAQSMLALGSLQQKAQRTQEETAQRTQSALKASKREKENLRARFGDKLDSLDQDRRNEIRAWAIANGLDQAATGKVKADVLQAYFDAHPEDN